MTALLILNADRQRVCSNNNYDLNCQSLNFIVSLIGNFMLHLYRFSIVYFIIAIYLFWFVLFYIFTCRVQGDKKLIRDTRLNMIQMF